MSNERIGFVGLGMMGLPMAKNLVEAGYTVTVFDLDAGAIEEAQGFGASPASTGAEVAAQSDIIITMVPDSPHVEAAIAGNGGIIEGIRHRRSPFVVGVQWHPEFHISPADHRIYVAFIDACNGKTLAT